MKKKNKYILLFSLLLLALMILGLYLRFYGTPGYIVLPEEDGKSYSFKMNSFMDAKYRFLLADKNNIDYYFISDLGVEECREYVKANIVSTENNISISGMFASVSCMRKNEVQPMLIPLVGGKYIVKVDLGAACVKDSDNVCELLVGVEKYGKGLLWTLRIHLYYEVVPFGLFYFLILVIYFLGNVLFKRK